MKYYCIETEECGWYTHTSSWINEYFSECPMCNNLVIQYTNDAIPQFYTDSTFYNFAVEELDDDTISE